MAGRPFIKGGSKLTDDMSEAGVVGAETESGVVEGGFSRLEKSTEDGGIWRLTKDGEEKRR